MSGPILLALTGAALALLGGLLAADGHSVRSWRAAIGLTVALVAGGIWLVAEPAGEIGHPIQADARDATGAPTSTTLVMQRSGGRRTVRRVPLQQPVDGGDIALALAMALGLLGGVLLVSGRMPEKWPAAVPGGLIAAGAAAPLVVWMGARRTASGEEGVRAWLGSYDTAALQSFTVPDLPWTSSPDGLVPLAVAAGLAGIGLLTALTTHRPRPLGLLVPGGAAVAAVAVLWQLVDVGGLPWRPAEGALWAVAALLATAAFDRERGLRPALLCALAAALTALVA